MEVGPLALLIAVAGTVGGVVNALVTGNAFAGWKREPIADDLNLWRPGLLGNGIAGGVSAFISWGLYSGCAAGVVEGPASETLAGVTGAVLVGFGGARILSAEVDKKFLRLAATRLAAAGDSHAITGEIATLSPADALKATSETPVEL